MLNLMRWTQADGLRVVAFLAKFMEPADDPVRFVAELLADHGADVGGASYFHDADDESPSAHAHHHHITHACRWPRSPMSGTSGVGVAGAGHTHPMPPTNPKTNAAPSTDPATAPASSTTTTTTTPAAAPTPNAAPMTDAQRRQGARTGNATQPAVAPAPTADQPAVTDRSRDGGPAYIGEDEATTQARQREEAQRPIVRETNPTGGDDNT